MNKITTTQPRHTDMIVHLNQATAKDIAGQVRRTMLLGGAPMAEINEFIAQAGMRNGDAAQVIELARKYVVIEGQPTQAEEQAAEDAAHFYWDNPAREL